MLTLYHAPRSRSTRILWLLEELDAPCEIVYVDIKRPTGGARDPRNPIDRANKREEAEKVDRRLADALAKGPYLLGEKFSAADIFLASIMQFQRSFLPEARVFDEFMARVSSRPALRRAIERDAPSV